MKKHTHHHKHHQHTHVAHPPKKHPLGNYFMLFIVVASLFALYAVWKDEINTLTGKVAYEFGLNSFTGDISAGNLGALRNLPPLNAPKKKNGQVCIRSSHCESNSCVSGKCVAAVAGARLPRGAAGIAAAAQRAQAPPQQQARGNILPGGIAAPVGVPGAQAGAQQAPAPAQDAQRSPPLPGNLDAGAQQLAERAQQAAQPCRADGTCDGNLQCVNSFCVAVADGFIQALPVPEPVPVVSPPVPVVSPNQPATAYKAMLGQPFLPVSILTYLRERRVEHAVPTCRGCSVVEFSCDANGLIKKSFSACGGDKTCTDGVCSAEAPKACASDNDCVSNVPPQKSCVNGFCQAQGFRSQPCKPDNTCQAGLVCYNNECVTPDVPPPGAVQLPEVVKKDAGQPCNLHSDCKTNYCNIQTFVCSVKSVGSDCEKNEECGSGVCQDGRKCVNAEGGACQSNLDCVSGACQNNICLVAPAGGFGQPCDPAVASSCVAPLVCNPASRMCAQPEGPVPVAESPAPAAVPVPLAPATGGACENVGVRQKIGDAFHECVDATGGASPELKLFRWRILLKQPCQNSDQCIPGAMCENSQCVGVAGTLCGNDNTLCAAGLVCDAATQKCAMAPEPAVPPVEEAPELQLRLKDLGESCFKNQECRPDFVCIGEPGRDINTPGVCDKTISCTDTDNGQNSPTEKGSVTLTRQIAGPLTADDSCVNEQIASELSCSPDLTGWQRVDIPCPQGTSCKDGACISVEAAAPAPEAAAPAPEAAAPAPEAAAPAPEVPICIDSNRLMDYIKQWRADKKRDECKGGAAGCIDSNKLMDYIKQWRADKKRDECKK